MIWHQAGTACPSCSCASPLRRSWEIYPASLTAWRLLKWSPPANLNAESR